MVSTINLQSKHLVKVHTPFWSNFSKPCCSVEVQRSYIQSLILCFASSSDGCLSGCWERRGPPLAECDRCAWKWNITEVSHESGYTVGALGSVTWVSDSISQEPNLQSEQEKRAFNWRTDLFCEKSNSLEWYQCRKHTHVPLQPKQTLEIMRYTSQKNADAQWKREERKDAGDRYEAKTQEGELPDLLKPKV